MHRQKQWIAGAAVLSTVLAGGAGIAVAAGPTTQDPNTPAVCQAQPASTPISTAKLYIEYNATDDDLGVHGSFDDKGWSSLCVLDPTGRPVLVVEPKNQLKDLTMGGIFFESREPPGAEFSMAQLKKAFPAGDYAVRAAGFDGKALSGRADFTYDVPAAPRIISPRNTPDEDKPARKVSRNDLMVAWEEVTKTVEGRPVQITGYEVIVTKVAPDDPNGFSRPTYDVHVPASRRSLEVPREFTEASTTYELEVLALEKSGNQTISVGFFRTT